MSTQIFDLTTIFKALETAETEFLGPGRQWRANLADQQQLLDWYRQFGPAVSTMADLKAKASRDVAVLNRFLRENGFTIQLEELSDPNGFGVVAILDRLVKWLEEGESCKLEVPGGRKYPAFRLTTGASFFQIAGQPAVCLSTQSGDKVWLTFADKELAGLALAAKILQLSKAEKSRGFFKGVVIPEVLIDQRVDISFLLSLSTKDTAGQDYFVDQALQQAKFAMNKTGARIKAATAMSYTLLGGYQSKPDLVFDQPFFLWMIGREKHGLPVAMMYVDRDCWRKADLNAI